MTQPARSHTLVILDASEVAGPALAQIVSGSQFQLRTTTSFLELVAVLSSERGAMVLVACEALLPSPDRLIGELRRRVPGTVCVVAHGAGSPHEPLLARLWATGAVDHVVARDASAELNRVLRQCYVDMLSGEGQPARDTSALELVRRLATGFARQCRIEGLVRDLHLQLPALVDYNVLQLAVLQEGKPKIFSAARRPADPAAVARLAEESMGALSAMLPVRISARDAVVIDWPPGVPAAAPAPGETSDQVFCLPMATGGSALGTLGLMLPRAVEIDAERAAALRLVAQHLAGSVRNLQLAESVERAAVLDELTGLHSRRNVGEFLSREWSRAVRHQRPFTAMLFELDGFGDLDRTYRYPTTDSLLAWIGAIVRAELRRVDQAIRYNNAQFLLLLPETKPEDALALFERLRVAIGGRTGREILGGTTSELTISAGVAGLPDSKPATPEDLIELADQALVAANEDGPGAIQLAHRIRPVFRAGASQLVPATTRPVAEVILGDAPIADRVRRVLTAAGYDVRIRGAEPPQERAEPALVVVAQSMLEQKPDVWTELSDNDGPVALVLLDEGANRRDALRMFERHRIQHMVSPGVALEESLLATAIKIQTGEPFGLERHLQGNVRSRAWMITRPEDKDPALASLRAWVTEAGLLDLIADLLLTSVDEMLINALYRPGPDGHDRPVSLRCASDGRHLAVAVTDSFGRLRRDDVYASLTDALAGKGREGKSSSRLGFRVMIEVLNQLAVTVDVGRCTEIVGVVDLRMPLREYRRAAPSVDVFVRSAAAPTDGAAETRGGGAPAEDHDDFGDRGDGT